MSSQNRYGLEEGATITIGDHEFTYHSDYYGSHQSGFVVAETGHNLPWGDGVSLYTVLETGQVDCCGALIGVIKQGEYQAYERPII